MDRTNQKKNILYINLNVCAFTVLHRTKCALKNPIGILRVGNFSDAFDDVFSLLTSGLTL